MKKVYSTVIHNTRQSLITNIVSGGRRGCQSELAANDLVRITWAGVAAIKFSQRSCVT